MGESAPGVAGTYTCNVTNDLGSNSMDVVAVGEIGSSLIFNFYSRFLLEIFGVFLILTMNVYKSDHL